MRRCFALGLMGIAVLGLALTGGRLLLPEDVATAAPMPTTVPGLEKLFSGGWLMNVHEPGGSLEVLLSLGAGGSAILNCTPVPTGNFNCTAVGSWKPVGPRELALTVMLFMRDYTMNLVCYEKGNFSLALSDDGNRLEGEGVIEIYVSGQNPLDPEEEPVMAVPVPLDAQRIAVVE